VWRIAVAFVVAPAIGAAIAALVATKFGFIYLGFFASALMAAYAVAALVGIPAFLFSRSWLRRSIWAYALAGAAVAAVAAVPMVFFVPLALAFLTILTGVVSGFTFGLIVMPTSNNRWRGP
jgi:hypothetical protein